METTKASEAYRLGMSRSTLYRKARAGTYDRIGRGLYRPADAPPADFALIEAASRRPSATICLTSALSHYDLIDAIPDAYDLAIPRHQRKPATQEAIRWHHFDRDTFDLGREPFAIPGSEEVIAIYSPERCIADAFRLRSTVGYEVAKEALRSWLARGGQPAQLMTYARQLPRVAGPLVSALEVLT